MPNIQIIQAHVAELADKAADTKELGVYSEDREIESTTINGRLRTKLNDSDEIVHEWFYASEIKLAGGNDAPTTEQAQAAIEDLTLFDTFVIEDTSKPLWQNDEATLVLKFRTGEGRAQAPSFDNGISLAKLVQELKPDEFNTEYQNYDLYIRLWWD